MPTIFTEGSYVRCFSCHIDFRSHPVQLENIQRRVGAYVCFQLQTIIPKHFRWIHFFFFLSDPLFSSQIPTSEAIFHRDSGSVCLKWQPASATLRLKLLRVCSFEPSTIILGGTQSRLNNMERASCAPPFVAMGNARDRPNFVTNKSEYLLPRLELVPASKVSPKTSCYSRLYWNCRSFVRKRRLKEGWSTVRSPLWVVYSNVQRAASNPIPHFAAGSVGSAGCIRVEACPPKLETIMWSVKKFSKFPLPYF